MSKIVKLNRKQIIKSNLNKKNLQNVINNAVETIDYDKNIIITNCNVINHYFESGNFYNKFYNSLIDTIKNNIAGRISNPVSFLYDFDFPIDIEFIGDPDKFLMNIYTLYLCDIYIEDRYKEYIHNLLDGFNMQVQFTEIYPKKKSELFNIFELRFHYQIIVTEGELFDKLFSYYNLLIK